jgi:hypothetical protein
VPNDEERHQGTAIRLKQNTNIKVHGYAGSSNDEPILLIRLKNGKYSLLEGWHRTMQNLLARPEGYNQQAYVLEAK